ncbi:CBM2 domain-containing protein OS=Streptomyces violarus OX=67380 GN=FHS41_001516 PE=4 SV=1 [Streptomyces violarus]
MWDAAVSQDGSRVTDDRRRLQQVVPAVAATWPSCFLASWRGKNSPPYDFTLNGQDCAKSS